MTKLEKIEQEISSLNPSDVHKLADWLAAYQADLWDKQIEGDAKSGRLDKFVETAKAEIASGKFRPW